MLHLLLKVHIGPTTRRARFAGILDGETLLRLIAVLGYPPALWFKQLPLRPDRAKPFPHPIRPDGYGIFLWLLKPFHSIGLVVVVQHLLGLAVGAPIYALLRRKGLPGWGANLAAPVLLDGGQIERNTWSCRTSSLLFLLAASITVFLWHPS